MRAVHALEAVIGRCLAIAILMCASWVANAAPLRIIAIGASNTHGWYVGNRGAYPVQLQTLLRAKGINAQVVNAGVPFNDRRFFVTKQERAANIGEMDRRLRARGIKVIVYDDDIPLRSIHLTPEGHAMIAAALLPRVMAILELRGAVNGHSTVAGSRP